MAEIQYEVPKRVINRYNCICGHPRHHHATEYGPGGSFCRHLDGAPGHVIACQCEKLEPDRANRPQWGTDSGLVMEDPVEEDGRDHL